MRKVSELMDLTGRIAIITGGAGHIGRAIAQGYLELGAKVALIDLAGEHLDKAAADLGALAAPCDLSDEQSVRDAADMIVRELGGADIVVNNAAMVGTSASGGWATSFETQSTELWRQALEINLTAPFVLVQQLAPELKKHGRGSIINVGSIYGLVGPNWALYEGTDLGNPAAYAASKGGLMQMTRWLATTLAPQVRVNALCPGGLERGQNEEFLQRYISRTPMGRMGTPEDMVGTAVYLGSDLSAYVTGQVIAVDGGWTVW